MLIHHQVEMGGSADAVIYYFNDSLHMFLTIKKCNLSLVKNIYHAF